MIIAPAILASLAAPATSSPAAPSSPVAHGPAPGPDGRAADGATALARDAGQDFAALLGLDMAAQASAGAPDPHRARAGDEPDAAELPSEGDEEASCCPLPLIPPLLSPAGPSPAGPSPAAPLQALAQLQLPPQPQSQVQPQLPQQLQLLPGMAAQAERPAAITRPIPGPIPGPIPSPIPGPIPSPIPGLSLPALPTGAAPDPADGSAAMVAEAAPPSTAAQPLPQAQLSSLPASPAAALPLPTPLPGDAPASPPAIAVRLDSGPALAQQLAGKLADLAQAVQARIALSGGQGAGRIAVALNPAGLGKLDIILAPQQTGDWTLSIEASSRAGQQAIARHDAALQQLLHGHGIALARLDIREAAGGDSPDRGADRGTADPGPTSQQRQDQAASSQPQLHDSPQKNRRAAVNGPEASRNGAPGGDPELRSMAAWQARGGRYA